MTDMQTDNLNDFLFIHIRPGIESKGHPLATIAVHLVTDDDAVEYGVALASQHPKKDVWDATMGRSVAAGRAARGKDRVFIYQASNMPRRELVLEAVQRVYDAVECGELKASHKVARALGDTIARLNMAKTMHNFDVVMRSTSNADSAAAE